MNVPTRQNGFTLIELMVTVAILGILAAIAIPNYADYLTRGRIPDAVSGLAAKKVRMEQYFQDNRTYVDAPACAPDSNTSPFFDFSCDGAPTAAEFTLQAVGKAAMTGFTFTINQAGTRTSTVSEALEANGWAGNDSCWIARKGGSC